ncbi:hypothetical protein FOZ63_026073, partial [Perkinsus olseni]
MVSCTDSPKADQSSVSDEGTVAGDEDAQSRTKLPELGEYRYGRVKPSLLGFRNASGFTGGLVGQKMSESLCKLVESDPRFMETVVIFSQKLISCASFQRDIPKADRTKNLTLNLLTDMLWSVLVQVWDSESIDWRRRDGFEDINDGYGGLMQVSESDPYLQTMSRHSRIEVQRGARGGGGAQQLVSSYHSGTWAAGGQPARTGTGIPGQGGGHHATIGSSGGRARHGGAQPPGGHGNGRGRPGAVLAGRADNDRGRAGVVQSGRAEHGRSAPGGVVQGRDDISEAGPNGGGTNNRGKAEIGRKKSLVFARNQSAGEGRASKGTAAAATTVPSGARRSTAFGGAGGLTEFTDLGGGLKAVPQVQGEGQQTSIEKQLTAKMVYLRNQYWTEITELRDKMRNMA